MSFDGLIPSVASGKCDIGACGITITAERLESVTFADPHFKTSGVVIILNQAALGEGSSQTIRTTEDLVGEEVDLGDENNFINTGYEVADSTNYEEIWSAKAPW